MTRTLVVVLESPYSFFTSHFILICFHVLRNQSVGPCLPQALWVSDMGVFILLAQKHSQILTKAGNLSAASQLEAGIIAIIH